MKIMGIKGYYLKPNFFTGETEKQEITFFLTDGGRTSEYSPIMRIKNVIISIDKDNSKIFVVIPEAYGTPFFAEININTLTGINQFGNLIDQIYEWLGYKQTWRKVGRDYKELTVIYIQNGETTLDVITGYNQ